MRNLTDKDYAVLACWCNSEAKYGSDLYLEEPFAFDPFYIDEWDKQAVLKAVEEYLKHHTCKELTDFFGEG